MGKQRGNKKKQVKQQQKKQLKELLKRENLPRVSLCTPTYNRRPFFKQTIQNVLHQTYPLEKIEWVIIDDGTDKIKDLVEDVSAVEIKYIELEEKISLGKKRNMLHKESTGEILIYIDDDDYYPPERVHHAVTELLQSKKLIAGSSKLYIWFKEEGIWQFGPYGPNHSTAGTFAFKRELLNSTHYEEDASFAEEKKFLHNYTIPLIQLDPIKTMLVFNHAHNTINKRSFLKNPNKFVKKTDYDVTKFIKNNEAKQFYTDDLHKLLPDYELGETKNKPDLLKALKERNMLNKEGTQAEIQSSENKIYMTDNDGKKREINTNEIIQIVNSQKRQIKERDSTLEILQKKVLEQGELIEEYKKANNYAFEKQMELEEKVKELEEKLNSK
jgi:glycosyltransferase involved in cell wall biosynthesis